MFSSLYLPPTAPPITSPEELAERYPLEAPKVFVQATEGEDRRRWEVQIFTRDCHLQMVSETAA
jgi:hypothetical protein